MKIFYLRKYAENLQNNKNTIAVDCSKEQGINFLCNCFCCYLLFPQIFDLLIELCGREKLFPQAF